MASTRDDSFCEIDFSKFSDEEPEEITTVFKNVPEKVTSVYLILNFAWVNRSFYRDEYLQQAVQELSPSITRLKIDLDKETAKINARDLADAICNILTAAPKTITAFDISDSCFRLLMNDKISRYVEKIFNTLPEQIVQLSLGEEIFSQLRADTAHKFLRILETKGMIEKRSVDSSTLFSFKKLVGSGAEKRAEESQTLVGGRRVD